MNNKGAIKMIWMIHLFFFTIGISLILIGTGMILLNWVPKKSYQLKELSERYEHSIDEDELCLFEGGYRIALGICSTIAGMVLPYHPNPILIYLIILMCFMIFYCPIKYLFFNP